MRITPSSTTGEILRELGERLRRLRLQENQSVSDLAERAGVGERTIGRVEAGENTSLESLVKILRALGRLDGFEALLPEPLVSPIQLVENRVRERQRAYAPRKKRRGAGAAADADPDSAADADPDSAADAERGD
ncbi:MAG TPA: helix-turn-helix domain-containing protein [Gemmatimonadaceae bacterium]|nr:helix-turn-helix domain-containing protein [Gemmatimonadaceae bacterium]